MKCKINFYLIFIGGLILFLFCLSGCRTWISLYNYSPTFNPKPYEIYKGHTVYMPSFMYSVSYYRDYYYYYYSVDDQIGYNPGQSIESYLRYAFQNAFTHAGLIVSDSPVKSKDGIMRKFKVICSTLTEEDFIFRVEFIQDGGIDYSKRFNITSQPHSEGMDKKELERKAYKMIDSAVTSILSDPAFQNAFFHTTASTIPAGPSVIEPERR